MKSLTTTCLICSKILSGKQTKFCSKKHKLLYFNQYLSSKERGIKRKIYFIKKLGGKCTLCHYNKNISALTFHHKNPKTKSFELNIRQMSNYSLLRLEKEISKCDLFCQNCHNEFHNPSLSNLL